MESTLSATNVRMVLCIHMTDACWKNTVGIHSMENAMKQIHIQSGTWSSMSMKTMHVMTTSKLMPHAILSGVLCMPPHTSLCGAGMNSSR